MIIPITERKLTPEEFLILPESDITYEFVDGYAVPKDSEPMAPKRFHSRIQPVLWRMLEDWCSDANCTKPGTAHTEWAIALTRKSKQWIPIPDVTYISDERLPPAKMTDDTCQVIPELVIEIISPSQSFGEISRKATDYLEAGIPRIWVVDSGLKSITVYYADAAPKTYLGSQTIEDKLLPGLVVVPQDVFEQARIP